MPSHPNAERGSGNVREHVLVMSKKLGRPLRDGETVHHKNGVKTDNRIANLELWAGNHGNGQRVSDLVRWAVRLLRRYAPRKLTRKAAREAKAAKSATTRTKARRK